MTEKEIKTQIALGTYLPNEWQKYLAAYRKLDTNSRTVKDWKLLMVAESRWYRAVEKVYGEKTTIAWLSSVECIINGTEKFFS